MHCNGLKGTKSKSQSGKIAKGIERGQNYYCSFHDCYSAILQWILNPPNGKSGANGPNARYAMKGAMAKEPKRGLVLAWTLHLEATKAVLENPLKGNLVMKKNVQVVICYVWQYAAQGGALELRSVNTNSH